MDAKFMALMATAHPTADQIGGLSQDQIGWLSQDQIGGLSQDHQLIIELAKNAPKVDKLYSRIAADIASESRKLDQSTFGPEEPPSNLCNTPMCIAGHTVNMAGESGYKLAHVFGFDGAARLIHIASRPEVSCPRYDSYPNEWALAYIQERAAEEKAVAAKKRRRKATRKAKGQPDGS
jgi:hypothetical protein